MKIKAFTKYLLWDILKPYKIFFAIIFAIMHIFMILSVTTGSDSTLSGMDFSTYIFLFIVGASCYREELSLAIQNGISRKTFFFSIGTAFVIMALIASAGDMLIYVLGNLYENITGTFEYGIIYSDNFMNTKMNGMGYLLAFLYQFLLNVLMLMAGLMITAFIYKLPKALKIIIPVSLYAIFFIIAPFIDVVFFESNISSAFNKALLWIVKEPSHMMLTSVIASVVFYGISFLLVRRVRLEDRK